MNMRQLHDRSILPTREVRTQPELVTRTTRIEPGMFILSPRKTNETYDGFTVPTTVLARLTIPDRGGSDHHFLVTSFPYTPPAIRSRGRHAATLEHRRGAERAVGAPSSTILGKHTLRSVGIQSTEADHTVMGMNPISIVPIREQYADDGRPTVNEAEGIIVHGGQGVTFSDVVGRRVSESFSLPALGLHRNLGDGLVAVHEKTGIVTITNHDMSTLVESPDDAIRTFGAVYVSHRRPGDY